MLNHEGEYLNNRFGRRLVDSLPLNIDVSDISINAANDILVMIDKMYGDNASQRQLAYHNTDHAIDVFERSCRLLNELQYACPSTVRPLDYELALLAASGHDMYQLEPGVGTNEARSANYVSKVMGRAGYSADARHRVGEAIMATTVDRSTEGQITQIALHRGERDILKFVIAMADINGIAMNGTAQMINDATNLYIEISGDENVNDKASYAQFLAKQGKFIQNRLDALGVDIEYYFDSSDVSQVKTVMSDIFSPSERALRFASWLEEPLNLDKVTSNISNRVAQGVSFIMAAREIGQQFVMQLTADESKD